VTLSITSLQKIQGKDALSDREDAELKEGNEWEEEDVEINEGVKIHVQQGARSLKEGQVCAH